MPSTHLALTNVVDVILNAVNDGVDVICVFMDLSTTINVSNLNKMSHMSQKKITELHT